MSLSWWHPALAKLKSLTTNCRRTGCVKPRAYRPQLEWLEDRRLLATFLVTRTNDNGPGTLRQAILDANANAGLDTIDFNIPGSGVQTISPTSALLTITDPVVIDGTSQPGFSGTPLIEVDGASVGAGNGLTIDVGGSTVRGLIINRFPGDGIVLQTSGGNAISGNYIGSDATGSMALGNHFNGIRILQGSDNNTISNNVLSGNGDMPASSRNGLEIHSDFNTVQGNFIGTDATGTKALGNLRSGVVVFGSGNTVVGNVLSANTESGIYIQMLPGTGPGSGNLVVGNFIGTDVGGTVRLGNGLDGVTIDGGSNNTIGGTAAGSRNIISGNVQDGVSILSQFGAVPSGNLVQGNFIGTQKDGFGPLGNGGPGVLLQGGASGNQIGGTAAGAGNTIADNGGAGVGVLSGTGNGIRGNSIFSNGNLGIHLNSANNANNNQAFPVLTSVVSSASGTTISGTLTSTPSTTFDLDFFSNTTADPSGFGQGQTFLGTATATTDASGNANFTVTVSTPVPSGQPFISATATDPNNNTSEFAKDIQVHTLTATGTTLTATEGAAFTAVVATFTDSDTQVSSGNFTATIDWGDGTTSAGTISGSAGSFAVNGSHTYAEEGSFTVTTKIHDIQDNLDATATSPATVADAALTPAATSTSAVEGSKTSVTNILVATFTDADPNGTASDYSATVNWGDGDTTATVSITADPNVAGQFDVTATKSNAYAEEGTKAVTVSINDAGGSTASANSTITVTDAALTASATSNNAVEGSKTSVTNILVATFTDADPNGTASDYSATINWGDGDTTATISITADPSVAGQFDVTATKSNAYAEEGTKAVTVSINDAGGSTTSANSTITVADAVLAPTATSNNAVEGNKSGVTKVLVATFTDADPNGTVSDYSATVNWGDGDTTASVSISADPSVAGQFDVTATKTNAYAEEGTKTVVVTITDAGGSSTTASSTIAVADAALTATAVAVCSAEGIPVSNVPVATFTDAGGAEPVGNYTATIDWGDGTASTAGTITSTGSTFTVLGSHTYTSEGTYAVHVSIQDDGGSTAGPTATATIGGFVTGLYQKVLIRVPDAPGLAFWVSLVHAGVPREQVAEAFWVSPEHRGLEVDQFYKTFFHRVADAGGRAFWVNALLAGAAENDVSVAFMVSDEYTQSHPDSASYITGLYNDVLRRAPDSGGYAFWKQILDNGVRGRAAIAYYFLTSTEAFLQAIDDYYLDFLGRTPAASEEQPFLTALESGATPAAITTIFLGSPEFLAREIATACQPM